MTLEEAKFHGKVHRIAEEEFNASFNDDEGGLAMNSIYRDFISEGSPQDYSAWIRRKLAGIFVAVDSRPSWVEGQPRWPFMNGRPMIFIAQVQVPKTALTEKELAPEDVLYIFGVRCPERGGYRLKYVVVEQNERFKSLVKGKG